MKKTLIIIAIISALLAMVFAGCKAAPQVPGVTAIQSAISTLPMVSPIPATTPYTAVTPAPSLGTPAAVVPTMKPTVGARVTP